MKITIKWDSLISRRGVFELSRKVIEADPTLAFRILGTVLIVKAECLFYTNAIEYMAYSPMFDEQPDGAYPNHYDVVVNGEEFMFVKR